MMMRNWTLVSIFATLGVVGWAQPPAEPPSQQPTVVRQAPQGAPVQMQVPPALNARPSAPENVQRATSTAKENVERVKENVERAKQKVERNERPDAAPKTPRENPGNTPGEAPKRPSPAIKTPRLSDPIPRGPEHAPGAPNANRRVDVPDEVKRVINERRNDRKQERTNEPANNAGPGASPVLEKEAKPARTPRIPDTLKRRNDDNPDRKVKAPVQTPPAVQKVSPDATPFVPADMPERLRKKDRDEKSKTPRVEKSDDTKKVETPGASPSTELKSTSAIKLPDGKLPDNVKPATTPSAPPSMSPPDSLSRPDTGSKPGETTATPPVPSPTAKAPDASPEPTKPSEPAKSPTPAPSPSPSPAVTLPRPQITPGGPAQTPSTDAGKKALETLKDRETISADKATKEDLNQAAQKLFDKNKATPPPSGGPTTLPAPPQLTPWVPPTVVTGDKGKGEQQSTSGSGGPVVVMPPPGATPTPTPAPDTIVVQDPSKILDNIKDITLAPTPPPAPTPGATPVATPPGVTPVPTNFRPGRDWVPYPGWRPPHNWNPPKGWTPPGGWTPPPGWRPPNEEWTRRLRHWGWSYIANRGWVVPVQWTPPPDFVVPPNWYYLPSSAYNDYGFYDPSEVVVFPGHARPDLQVNINLNQVYMPPSPPPTQLTEMPPPPPRPAPPEPPRIPQQITNVETVAQILTRPRDPNGPRYQGPVLVTGSVHFDFDSYAIRPDSFPTLNAIGQALVSELPDAIINIEGHTDSKGTDEYNQTLSEQRAWSVKSYLVQQFGLDPNRLIIVGYGEGAPIADNATDAGRARNRRVEFENVTDLYKAQVVDTTTPQ